MSSTTATTANPGTDDGVQLKYLALITLIIPLGIVCFVLYICYDRRQRKSQMMAIKMSGERCVGEPDNENINQALAADDDDDAENNNKRCTTGNYNPRLVWPNRNLLNGHVTEEENMVKNGANHRREHSDSESTFDPLGHEAQSQQERRARRRLRVLQHDNVTNIVNVNGTKVDESKENNENNARSINLYSPVDIHVEGNVNSTGTFTKSNVFNSKFSNSKCTEAAGKLYSQQNVQLKSNDLLNNQYIDVDNNDYEYDESADNSSESSDAYGPIYAQSLMQTKGASSTAELIQKLKNNTVGVNKLTSSSVAKIAGANTDNAISSKSKSMRISYNEPQSTGQELFNSQKQNDNTHSNSCEVYKESIIPTVRHYDPTVYNATTQVLLNMHEAPIEASNDSAFCNSNANGEIKSEGGNMNVLDSNTNNNNTTLVDDNSVQRERSSISSSAKMEIHEQSNINCALPNVDKAQEVTKLTETTAAIHKRTLSDALRRKEESAFENILEQASLPPIVPKELHGKSICNAAQQNISYLNATSNNLRTANVINTSNVNAKKANENQSHNDDVDDAEEERSYEYETADSDEDVSGKRNKQIEAY